MGREVQLRGRHEPEDAGDDRVRRDAIGQRRIRQDEAMAEDVGGELGDVRRQDVAAAAQHGPMGPMEGHEPLIPKEFHHYDLHAWLFKDNPEGMFSPTNPDVKCDGYAFSLLEEPTKMVHP